MENKYQNGQIMINGLHTKIRSRVDSAEIDQALWQTVIAYQDYPFYTSSGLPFSYTVKRTRSGEYGGEIIVSRKEESKTLTKSSVMLAFHKVIENIETEFQPVFYKGPKAIGQIFGISYIYSMFWKFGLIEVPEKVKNKLQGNL